jgi:hypothetical protein
MLLNCIAERMHVIFISEEDRESLSKVRQSFVTRACIKRNRAQPRRTSSPANAMSIRDPVPGRRSSRSIFFAVITKRAAAMPTITVPRTINASPAMLHEFLARQSVFRLPWHRDPRHTPRFALRPGWFTRTPDRIAASATHDGLGRLFRHRLWALLAPRVSVQSSLGRTRRDSILANRSQSKLRCVERAGPPSTQTRSDSPALGRLSPGRGLSQDGNRSSFGPHPESATGRPSVYSGARHRGIRPDPQDLASAQLYRRPQLREAHSQPAESR